MLPASKSRSANAAEYSDGAFDRSRAVAVRRTPPVLAYSLAASGTASMVTAPAYASSISAAGVALAAADERRSTPPRAGGTSGGLNRTGIRSSSRVSRLIGAVASIVPGATPAYRWSRLARRVPTAARTAITSVRADPPIVSGESRAARTRLPPGTTVGSAVVTDPAGTCTEIVAPSPAARPRATAIATPDPISAWQVCVEPA